MHNRKNAALMVRVNIGNTGPDKINNRLDV